jgi:PAS domain S-box-containing protein
VHSKGPRKWSEDETALTRDVAERTLAAVERARAEAQLRESEERYRTLFEAAELRAAELEAVLESMSDAVYIGNIEGITLINQAALDQLGFTTKEELNRHVAALVEDIQTRDAESGLPIPLEQQAFVRALNGERVIHEVLVRHKISGEERIVRCAAAPVRIDGRVIAAVAVNTDITEAKRAEATLHRNFDDLRALQERQEILVAELQHRVRNMLTVVRSVFARTVDVSRDVPELSQHFRGRLDALARTQVIVTQSPRGLVDLEGLVRDELLSVAASDGPLLTIEGPDIALTPKIAESMGLAIHELTMNAVKYGALKVTGATLAIEWTIDLDHSGQRRLTFRWTEQGVPAVPLQPAREGFGRELIEDALPYQMGADTSLEFRGGGICCTISVLLPEAENASAPLGARGHG